MLHGLGAPSANAETAHPGPSRTRGVPSGTSGLTCLTCKSLGSRFQVVFVPLHSFYHFHPPAMPTKYTAERNPRVQAKDEGEQQGSPKCLLGALASWASKPQPRGKPPPVGNAQSLAIRPSPMTATSLCGRFIPISELVLLRVQQLVRPKANPESVFPSGGLFR